MSEFSKHLENYIQEHDITIADLAAETKIDRITIYRYVKGTRKPADLTVVENILNALRMRNAEKEVFLEEYDKLIMGEAAVDNYKYVKKLLKDLRNVAQDNYTREHVWKSFIQLPLQEKTICLNSQKEIEMCAIALFENVVKEGGPIHLLMQPVYETLQELLVSSFLNKNIKVEQIVCLEQNIQKSYRNLEIFRLLLPACFADMNYEVLYYYSSLNEHINEMSWMPNVILAGSYVLQFDYEMKQGVFLENKEYAGLLYEQWQYQKKNSEQFLIKTEGLDSAHGLYEFMGQNFKEKTPKEERVMKAMFVQPCFGMCISSDMYKNYLYETPMKDAFIQGMTSFRGDWDGLVHINKGFSMSYKTINYFQLSGIKDFIENGRIREFPSGFYEPLPKDVCKVSLERMLILAEEGNIEYSIIPDEIEMPPNMCFYLGNEECMFINMVKDDSFIGIKVAERGIRQVFGQYLNYLEEKHMIVSPEQSVEMLREIIKES